MSNSFYFKNVSKYFRVEIIRVGVCPSTERNRFHSIHNTGNRSYKNHGINTIRHKWIARSGKQRPDRVCVARHSLAFLGNLKR